jgi:hydroxypyruvate reductase
VFLVAAGKAAWPMATAFASLASNTRSGQPCTLSGGVIAGPRVGTTALPRGVEWFDAAHPAPDKASEAAGRRALEMAAASRPDGSLVVLLSGGASSMLAVPAGRLSLSEKIATAGTLMKAGTAIADLNCVRKHLSAIKGGRLAAAARRTITLAISDVHQPVADDPAVIGSGPTVGDPTTCADALSVIRRAGVEDRIPATVVAHLERCDDETPKPGDRRLQDTSFEVLANRQLAVDAAARTARTSGYDVYVIDDPVIGEAREAGAAFAAQGVKHAGATATSTSMASSGRRVCVIGSGETTVRVRGAGRGGRNQEFALAALPVLGSLPRGTVAVLASAGTDGIDGPTDAAGAFIDTSTALRAARAGVSSEQSLAENGAYDFFEPLGDLIVWGPTGTNVGDLHIMLIG